MFFLLAMVLARETYFFALKLFFSLEALEKRNFIFSKASLSILALIIKSEDSL